MILRGINFGPAWLGSGAAGFFGEGYWFHDWLRLVFYNSFCPEEFTFVAKTTTIESRLGKEYEEEGWMALNGDFSPRDKRPDCIILGLPEFIHGDALNAVGLAGPGAFPLFRRDEWQNRMKPFFLSFMTVKKGEEAVSDMEKFRKLLKAYLPDFRAPVGLQINLSCPNAGVNLEEAARDALIALDIFESLGIPLVPKFNLLTPVEVVKVLAEHPACDAIHTTNTIPYGKHEKIRWRWGDVSPLAKYGGGGYSGAQLFPLVCEWVKEARAAGITVPINVGGGISHPRQIDQVAEVGGNGISIATVVAQCPWKLRSILERAHQVFPTN